MALLKTLFRLKPPHSNSHHQGLYRCLTASDLVVMGIGAIVGAGIFVLTGIAAAKQAGPAITLSYVLASFVCGCSALAYAELASSVGGCGGAYTYAFVGIGEFIAWLIGWDLLLEYGMNAATISIGWGGYLQSILQTCGITIPKALSADPFNGGIVNLPAMSIVLLLAAVLSIGTRESARFNKIIVIIKLAVIAIFIGIATFCFDPAKWKPFMPFGVKGIVNGAGFIFFAYLGFDAISTTAEEVVNPARDLPIGILVSLVICTILYVIVAGLLTGIMYYPELNVTSPVSTALLHVGYKLSSEVVAIGAIAGLTTAIFAMYYGCTRVYLAMSRDGLIPKLFTNIHPRSRSPRQLVWFLGSIMALIAGFLPIDQIANIVNIGALAAFAGVSISVVVLRRTKPDMPRPFKTPWSPFIPILGVVMCLYLMGSLPLITWVSFFTWMAVGLVFYFGYSRFNSVLHSPSS